MIRAGDLRHSIDLLTITQTQDATGQASDVKTVLATVRAGKQAPKFADVQRAQLQATVADARFLIRYRDDVTATMMVRHQGTDYSILSVEEIGFHEGLALVVRSAV